MRTTCVSPVTQYYVLNPQTIIIITQIRYFDTINKNQVNGAGVLHGEYLRLSLNFTLFFAKYYVFDNMRDPSSPIFTPQMTWAFAHLMRPGSITRIALSGQFFDRRRVTARLSSRHAE